MNGRLVSLEKHEYELLTGRLRSTDLKHMISPQGPRSYYWNVLCAEPEDLTEIEKWNTDGEYRKKAKHFMQGNLFHELMLDGRIGWYETEVTRNINHKAYQAELDAAEGKPILSASEVREIQAWFEGAMRNKQIRAIIEGPRLSEQVVLWDETVEVATPGGRKTEVVIPCKLSYDLWCPDARYCIKTTAEATPDLYRRQANTLKYHVSGAFYERGARSVPELRKVRAPFKHIVVMKEHPNYSYVWEMSRIWINAGHRQVQLAIDRIGRCQYAQSILPVGAETIDAWPDYLEENTDAQYMVPDSWMIESYGATSGEYDPFEEYMK